MLVSAQLILGAKHIFMQDTFDNNYKALRAVVESWLESSSISPFGELSEAENYSLLAGGKRVRPVLTLAVADSFGLERESLKGFCIALELLHTASLIHDDLPALDDDELRRGKPTCHKVHGEAVALLAGDSLIARALGLVSQSEALAPEVRCSLTVLLSDAFSKLCYGQVLDLNSEQGESEESLKLRHEMKTAALIEAACVGPARVFFGPQGVENIDKFQKFGKSLGLLFQISDDLLDVTGTSEELGKDAASDERQNTSTYVSMYGLAGAKQMARKELANCKDHLSSINLEADFLSKLCDYVFSRTS